MRCDRPTLEILSQGVIAALVNRFASAAPWSGKPGGAARQRRADVSTTNVNCEAPCLAASLGARQARARFAGGGAGRWSTLQQRGKMPILARAELMSLDVWSSESHALLFIPLSDDNPLRFVRYQWVT